MPAINLQSIDPVLKTLFTDQKVANTVYRNRPFFGWVPKFEGFTGRNLQIPIQYGNPQGRSATFAFAQSNNTAALFKAFFLTRRRDYGTAGIDGETARASDSDRGAFLSAVAVQIDGAMASLADSYSAAAFRNGTGSIGQVGSISTNTLTLTLPSDVTCFEVGQTLVASPTDGAATRTGQEVIAAVNRSTGTLTSTSATWTTNITALVANDFLLVQGDLNAKMHGLDAWIPATAPLSGESFQGVDRSPDSRLFGTVYDATGGDSMEEAFINAQSQGAREGARIDQIWCAPLRLRDLQKGAQSKTQYQRTSVNAQSASGSIATVSYRGIVVDGDEGPITVMSDPRCPANVAYALTSDTVRLNTMGAPCSILSEDGLRMLRDPTADSYTVRCGGFGNFSVNAPGFNVRIKFA